MRFSHNGKSWQFGDQFTNIDFRDPDFASALSCCLDDEYDLVTVSGAGGCGKSVIYRIVADFFSEKCLCTASTGVAAFNLREDGVALCTTIHSALKIKPVDWYDWTELDERTTEILRNFRVLLIDEISMVDCNLMDYVLSHVRAVNHSRHKDERLRVILFGDVLQLAPVHKLPDSDDSSPAAQYLRKLWQTRYGQCDISYWFFSPIYRATRRKTFELKAVYRQKDDGFRKILDIIREDRKAELDGALQILNRSVMDSNELASRFPSSLVLYLSGRNADVNRENGKRIRAFKEAGEKKESYEAIIQDFSGNDSYFERYRKNPDLVFSLLFPTLVRKQDLYVGMQVMVLANDPEGRFQNGTLGIIQRFVPAERKELPPELWDNAEKLKCPVVRDLRRDREFVVPFRAFESFYPKFDREGKLIFDVSFRVCSIACKCAYAVTFHKAQGLTLDAVYINTGESRSDVDEGTETRGNAYIPDSGIYLGLSRARTLAGVGLSGEIYPEMIHINRYALEFRKEIGVSTVQSLDKSIGANTSRIRNINRVEHLFREGARGFSGFKAITGFDLEDWHTLLEVRARADQKPVDARERRVLEEAEDNDFISSLIEKF